MSEMIERVAKAIYEADDVWSEAFPWPTMGSDEQSADNYRRIARAAIQAMRVPTKEMVLAGLNCDAWADNEGNAVEMLSGTFTAAIDAALKEQTK